MSDISNYVEVLESTLQKKIGVLQALLESTIRQKQLTEAEDFDLDSFQVEMDQKEALLNQLEELDLGFEQVFEKVGSSMKDDKEKYRNHIASMQEAIRKCTELGMDIQKLENQNKERLDKVFSVQHKELRQIKTSTKVASQYYKTMSNSHNQNPYFMDQKK